MTNALMLQGTASGVGKSILTAGLCRILARSGVDVVPFKPQNMSNNAAICPDGAEIGRAQALQAFACGLEPTSDMNPVLLKPEHDRRAQLVVQGRVRGTLSAERFRESRSPLLPEVLASFDRLRRGHEWVLVEGAGSPAEPNLRRRDIANMGFAEAADVPVWLIGDIDRGGVFAALVGSLDTLSSADRQRVQAILINRFRGAANLLDDAIDWLVERTRLPMLGVVPLIEGLHLPEEDSPCRLSGTLHQVRHAADSNLRVAVVRTPRASNLTDFDALERTGEVDLLLVRDPRRLDPVDLIILPGSKSVLDDLEWLREAGWTSFMERHLRYGGKILGICGGMQMLGRRISDPHGIEGGGEAYGLDWLEVDTSLSKEKTTKRVRARAFWPRDVEVEGYEIHHGITTTTYDLFPLNSLSPDDQVAGTYLHGIFDRADFRSAFFSEWFGRKIDGQDESENWRRELDRLADSIRAHVDLSLLEAQIGRRLE